MVDQCPGASNIRVPRIEMKACPRCGEEIETFSNEASARCMKCGFVVYNDLLSCVEWCEYARECVGEQAHLRIMQQITQRKERERGEAA